MSNDSAIHLWLSQLPDCSNNDRKSDRGHLKRPRELEMTTPPRTGSLSPGPKKRKIDDDSRPGSHKTDPDPDATPRSGRSQRPAITTLSMRTTFPPPPSLSHSSAASMASDRQDRSSRALYAGHPPPGSVYRKPEEGNGQDGVGRNDGLEERFFDYLPLSALFAGTAEGASLQARIAHAEFYKVRGIKDDARECLALRRAEAAWNAKVHGPLLELALSRRHASVICENATSARILSCFLPSLITGEVAEGKMVDFVLAPDLGSESQFDSAIQNKLVELAKPMKSSGLISAHLCVNQTDYPPLMRSPAAVTMETKAAGASLEEGRLQLGIWTAAWHKRMETLGVGGGKPGPQLPTLPLILTHDHEWSLYFAVDRLDKIDVFGPMQIGMTDNLLNIYQLLTVLGFLGTWIDTTFRSWVINAFCPRT
ncbi:hypothetical protein N657DRAFT_581839 [Parathielavia appendiculata]|uniref:PD-(D/E)XK nuclease-like domain-containing protein n=1 Tax=Parathielavia appendiculata TaxID=2587402 RepID=A0AAN6YZ09_9PEZI|nr:hypothetical protein N657DRAFT_581839 [Parathielavia appendiculata]